MSIDDTGGRMAALVAAEPLYPAPPDLAALRAGGRRLVRRRRLASGVAAVVVVLAVGVPVAVVADGDDRAVAPGPIATSSPGQTPPTDSPTDSPTDPPTDPPPATTSFPERGEVPLPGGGSLVGEWEDGEVLGAELALDSSPAGGGERILYAASRRWPGEPDPATYVAVGVRADGRVLRLVSALAPLGVTEPDGIDLWGGDRLGDGSFLLVGSVPGAVGVEVSPGAGQRGAAASTDVLPGHTVFWVTGTWRDGWDPTRLAPLTVTTEDSVSVTVRGRSGVS